MKRILLLVTLVGRRLAADGVPFIAERHARRVLVLSAMLTAAMVMVLLGYATSARADVVCDGTLRSPIVWKRRLLPTRLRWTRC
jgi:hypothetical protein